MRTKLPLKKIMLWISLPFLLVNCKHTDTNSSERSKQVNPNKTPKTPRELVFFDERIAMTDFDLTERLDRELLV